MYAGITIGRNSGKIIGAHQKIDRIAWRNLGHMIDKSCDFPSIGEILHFEGKNGPDGLKTKRASKDIPWHFLNPLDIDDKHLVGIINNHVTNLSKAIHSRDAIKASFEAAWLAHAITDGLTPPHLDPINDKIEGLFGASPRDMGYADKRLIKGDSHRDTIKKNWEYWGAGGLILSHLKYEIGVATAIASEKFIKVKPSSADLDYLEAKGFEASFLKSVRKINSLNSYKVFAKNGLTMELVYEIKQIIVPEIINCVTLAWYFACINSK